MPISLALTHLANYSVRHAPLCLSAVNFRVNLLIERGIDGFMQIGIVRRHHAITLVIVAVGCGGRESGINEPAGGSLGMSGALGAGGIKAFGGSPGNTATGGDISSAGVPSENGVGGWPGNIATGGGTVSVGGTSTSNTNYCPNTTPATPCGGRIVGRWIVYSGNLTVSGNVEISLVGLGCQSVRADGCLTVSGIWTALSDGSYEDDTTTTGNVTFALPPACLSVSSVPIPCAKAGTVFSALGWDSTSCTDNQGACYCFATVNQRGGLGVISTLDSVSGSYHTTGDTLTTDDATQYSYCVSGTTLTMTPSGTASTSTLQLWMNGSTGGAMNNGG